MNIILAINFFCGWASAIVSVGVENLWWISLISLFRLQDVAFISKDITTERLADNHNFDPKSSQYKFCTI